MTSWCRVLLPMARPVTKEQSANPQSKKNQYQHYIYKEIIEIKLHFNSGISSYYYPFHH
jgi:hypothetical protein